MLRLLVPFGALFAIAAAQIVPAPVRASASLVPGPVAPQLEEATADPDELFSNYLEQLTDHRFDDALVTAGQFSPDKMDRNGTAIALAMRAGALLGLNKDQDAKDLFRQADTEAPSVEFISVVQFVSGAMANRPEFALDALDRMIRRFPDAIHNLDVVTVYYVLRREPKDQQKRNDDRTVSLAQLGFDGDDGDGLTFEAVEILHKRGDRAGATDLLRYIDDPQLVEDLLVRKRFAALWPAVEAIAGPHLEKVRNSSTSKARNAYAAAPTDTKKLHFLVSALRFAGFLDEAIALRSKLPSTSAAMAAADMQMGYAVNHVALALYSAGRPDDADQLFALLNDAPMADGRWRVTTKINRLELLVGSGKFARAVPLLDVTEASARDDGNDYARQLVRNYRFCTLSGAGKSDEAAKLLPEVMSHADDARSATIDGLVCAGKLDEAEKLALASLVSESFETSFVRQLQRARFKIDDPSIWAKGWQALRQRPAIAKEFKRLGRDMPEAFQPPDSP